MSLDREDKKGKTMKTTDRAEKNSKTAKTKSEKEKNIKPKKAKKEKQSILSAELSKNLKKELALPKSHVPKLNVQGLDLEEVREKEFYKNSRLNKSENFINRELSWLAFNKRVLSEAKDKHVPLFERLKFLSISASNLDEFFMVRVASLMDMVHAKYTKPDISGLTPKKQLELIAKKTHKFVKSQYITYSRSLIPALKKAGLHIIEHYDALSPSETEYVNRYFAEQVYPVITAISVDNSKTFPLIRNKSLNIAALLCRKEEENIKSAKDASAKKKSSDKPREERLELGLVQVPSILPRIVEIPQKYTAAGEEKGEKADLRQDGDRTTVIFLEEIMKKNIEKIFAGSKVVTAQYFRIMRNAEFVLDEEDAADLLEEISKKVKKRQRGEAIRLEVEEGMDERLLHTLEIELDIEEDQVFAIRGPIDLTVLMKLYELPGFSKYKDENFVPGEMSEFQETEDIFSVIRKRDILMSHPYDSFAPVIEFMNAAADDENVLAIKQTLYRVSGNSPIIAALERAAGNGKQVTVLMELKARFDEENNINWATRLEKSGCHVIYGIYGLKTHSKITLVVRKEGEGIRRYVHLGTGNYNDSTAKLYTDFGMFTAREDYGEDASAVFKMLSGYSESIEWKRLVVAPLWMKDRFLEMIKEARETAMAGRRARIIAKMNSLSDKDIIIALYKAAEAGVEIDLIVRGICCLKVGLEECKDRIRVRSIVGTFLEHARVFYFDIDGKEEYYLGSADWMNRNLEKRVEIVFPVADEHLCRKLKEYLELQLSDNVKASLLMPDGDYEKAEIRGGARINAQEILSKRR